MVVVEIVVPLEANMWDSRRALPRGGEKEDDDPLGAGGVGTACVAWLWLHSDIVLLASMARVRAMSTTWRLTCATRRGAADKRPQPKPA